MIWFSLCCISRKMRIFLMFKWFIDCVKETELHPLKCTWKYADTAIGSTRHGTLPAQSLYEYINSSYVIANIVFKIFRRQTNKKCWTPPKCCQKGNKKDHKMPRITVFTFFVSRDVLMDATKRLRDFVFVGYEAITIITRVSTLPSRNSSSSKQYVESLILEQP